MFNHSTKPLITGGTFTQINNNNTKDGFDRLQKTVAHGAFHNSGERFDPPKCHENTRSAVLQRIMDWILCLDTETRDATTMWLYGPAGAGKSAIAQTIAEMLEAGDHPISSFFFLRHDPMRGSAKALVPTLVYQMILAFPPTFREVVVQSIERDPLIFTKSLEAQFTTLILAPLEQLFLSGFSSNLPLVIIIDGLDECDDRRMQPNIIDVACKVQQRLQFIPLLFLIASRPEVDIVVAFEKHPSTFLSQLALDDTYLPDQDIHLFLTDNFKATKMAHRLRFYIPESWPAEEAIETLVRKSSGQFIYAATVVKFVTDSRGKPHDRLDIVLGLRPVGKESPFAELDALYTHILSGVDNLEAVLDVVGLTILRPSAGPARVLHMLNGFDVPDFAIEHLERFMGLDPGDITILLQDLGSLIVLTGVYSVVKLNHASLEDFLFDKSRSRNLYMNREEMHLKYAIFALKAVKTFSSFSDVNVISRICYHTPLAQPKSSLTRYILGFPFQKLLSSMDNIKNQTRLSSVCFFVGGYLQYLDSLTWEDVKQFRHDQLEEIDRYLEAHLLHYYTDDDLLLLLAAFSGLGTVHRRTDSDLPRFDSPFGSICASRSAHFVDEKQLLQLYHTIFINDFLPRQFFEPALHAYREGILSFINDPERSRHLYLSGRHFGRAALTAVRRVSEGCVWASIPPQNLSSHDMYIRRNFPTKWRRKPKKRDRFIVRTMQTHVFREKNNNNPFLDLSMKATDETMSSVFQAAAFLLPFLLPKSQISDELTQLAQNMKFGRRAKEYPSEVKAAKRAIKDYLARVDGVATDPESDCL